MCLSPEGRGVWLFPANEAGVFIPFQGAEGVGAARVPYRVYMGERLHSHTDAVNPFAAYRCY